MSKISSLNDNLSANSRESITQTSITSKELWVEIIEGSDIYILDEEILAGVNNKKSLRKPSHHRGVVCRNSYLLLRIYRMIVAGFLLRFWNGFKGK
ncbi:hypothetical protein LEP1GSC171_1010 [Leptospira santarosai str. HAI1380]|nr:hypothetical protein LEP1GSC171_1010 [Leptospira santarosai str. HAI1380]